MLFLRLGRSFFLFAAGNEVSGVELLQGGERTFETDIYCWMGEEWSEVK